MPRTAEITVKLAESDVRALNRAANDVKKLAATAPRGYLRALRAGMRLQRAMDRVVRAKGRIQ